MIARNNAVMPYPPAADHTGKEGYFVELSGGEAAICDSAADVPFGLILTGAPVTGHDAVAVAAGGFTGTVKVKVTGTTPGTIVAGTKLTLVAGGTVKADAGSGARVQVAQALEPGAADELIEAVIFPPVALS